MFDTSSGGGPWVLQMLGQRNQAQSMWGDYLKQMQGLQQGRISPTELPQFRNYMQELMRLSTVTDANLLRDMVSRGVSGGALGDLMTRSAEGRFGDIGRQLNQFVSDAYGQIPISANQTLNQWMKMQQIGMQADEAREARKAQEDAAKKQMFFGGLSKLSQPYGGGMSGGGGGCCFIFIEGEGELTGHVRKFRDAHFGENSNVGNGYKKMASWLVPMMKRNKFVKKLVQWTMTKPLSWCAKHYGEVRVIILAPLGFMWVGVWSVYGKLRVS